MNSHSPRPGAKLDGRSRQCSAFRRSVFCEKDEPARYVRLAGSGLVLGDARANPCLPIVPGTRLQYITLPAEMQAPMFAV
jgi:hypothetical protein